MIEKAEIVGPSSIGIPFEAEAKDMRDLIKHAISIGKHCLVWLACLLSGTVVIAGIFSVMLLGTMLAIAYQSA